MKAKKLRRVVLISPNYTEFLIAFFFITTHLKFRAKH